MSAIKNQSVNHDVRMRNSWTLRPPISKHKDDWEKMRDKKKDVCSNCHQQCFVNGHYSQSDDLVNLLSKKFAKPAGEITKRFKDTGVMKSRQHSRPWVEWEYRESWHYKGRRTRMGTAMIGPDYA